MFIPGFTNCSSPPSVLLLVYYFSPPSFLILLSLASPDALLSTLFSLLTNVRTRMNSYTMKLFLNAGLGTAATGVDAGYEGTLALSENNGGLVRNCHACSSCNGRVVLFLVSSTKRYLFMWCCKLLCLCRGRQVKAVS